MVEEPRKSELRSQLQTIISTYCAKYDVAYWQGMHDMVAVLLLMEPQPPLPKIFLLLSMFLQTFLPYVFDDHDCMFLHHLFEMIRLLLQYHDPRNVPSSPLTVSELALYLQSHNVIPSIFSPPWLLTLFAHDMSQPLLLTIWDQYIFYKNPAIHVFTVLSHLISNKQRILTYPPSELLQLITHLPFENDESSFLFDEHSDSPSFDPALDEVCRALNAELRDRHCDPRVITDVVIEGRRLMQQTPPGFVHRLNDLLNDKVSVSLESLQWYQAAPCVATSPVEIYTFLLRGVERNVNCLRYLLLDTRSAAAFRRAHIASSKNVSAHTLQNAEKTELLLRKARSHDYHVVVLDNGREREREEDVGELLVRKLVQNGCKFVSRIVGGFERVAKLIELEADVTAGTAGLIVHDETSQITAEELLRRSEFAIELRNRKPRQPVRTNSTNGETGETGETEANPSNSEESEKLEKPEKPEKPEKQEKSEKPEKQEMIKTIDGKQCLLYECWLSNGQVKDFACMKVQKVQKEGKEVFVYTTEKRIVLTK